MNATFVDDVGVGEGETQQFHSGYLYTRKKKKKKKGCKEGGNEKICSQGVQIRVIINKPYIKEQQDEIQYGVILISNIHYITI